jgi:hypothetical protein
LSDVAGDDSNDDSDLEFSLHQNNGKIENTPSAWILIDNQSTVDTFSNTELLSDIRQSSITSRFLVLLVKPL